MCTTTCTVSNRRTIFVMRTQLLLNHVANNHNMPYSTIINRNLANAASLAVATNNLIALREVDGLDFNLSQRQKEALYSNRVLLLLQANKLDQAQELVFAPPDMFADSTAPVVLQAAVRVREEVPKAEEVPRQFADMFPEKSKPVHARAQIAGVAGHSQISAESLSKIPDISNTCLAPLQQ